MRRGRLTETPKRGGVATDGLAGRPGALCQARLQWGGRSGPSVTGSQGSQGAAYTGAVSELGVHTSVAFPGSRPGPSGGTGTLTFSPLVPFRPRMPSAPCAEREAEKSQPRLNVGLTPNTREAERPTDSPQRPGLGREGSGHAGPLHPHPALFQKHPISLWLR